MIEKVRDNLINLDSDLEELIKLFSDKVGQSNDPVLQGLPDLGINFGNEIDKAPVLLSNPD